MVEIIKFVLKHWKYFAIVLITATVSSYITFKIQDIRYKNLENQFNGCKTSLNFCMSANEENYLTIQTLQKELTLNQKACENRIKHYKKLLKDMQNIDNLTGGRDEKGTINCPDDVCVMLNSMWK